MSSPVKITRQSEARLARAVDSAAPAVWDWDVATQTFIASARLYDIYGLPREGESDWNSFVHMTHAEDIGWADGIKEGTLKGRSPSAYRYRIRRADDNTLRWLRVQVAIEKNEREEVAAYTGLVEDVTNQTHASHAVIEGEERLRLAIEAGKMALWEVDLNAGTVTVTPELNVLFGFPIDAKPTFAEYRSRYAPGEVERLGREGATLEVVRARFARGEFDRKEKSELSDHTHVQAEVTIVMPSGRHKRLLYRAQYAYTWEGRPKITGLLVDISERKEAEEKLSAATAKFKSVFNQSGIFAGILDLHGVLREVNDLAVEMCGYSREKVLNQKFWETPWWRGSADIKRRIHEATSQARSGTVFREELRYWLADGSERVVDFSMHPIRDQSGKVTFLHPTGIDITERKKVEDHARMLMGEVNHRAKNILNLVQAIARQTIATEPREFVSRFQQRVQALSANQDLLVKSGWKSVPIESLIRAQLEHFQDLLDKRILISGPSVKIQAAAAQTLSMALHELATNAIKYGALSVDDGRVTIDWSVNLPDQSSPVFEMRWAERNGPSVATPTSHGFGSTVLEKLAKMSLGADILLDYAASGVVWQLTSPLDRILDETELANAEMRRSHTSTVKKKVLVVEDEPLAAIEVAEELAAAGFEVIGPARSVAQAFTLLDTHGCDFAALDVNLGNETAEPIAYRLLDAGTPFVTMSGYAREQLPSVFLNANLLVKPLRFGLLVKEIRRLAEKQVISNDELQ